MSNSQSGSGSKPPARRKQLPGELSPGGRLLLRRLIVGTVLVGLGALGGLALSPESPAEATARTAALELQLQDAKRRISELEWSVKHPAPMNESSGGRLKPADRLRHERESRRYATILRHVHAQGAAELISWFVTRWNSMLDSPTLNDRTGRRAELLSLLVGGMAANLDPRDYVAWQAEFLNGNWLGDLHFDLDGDGYPGKRSMPNPHDGFANTSVCQIAMALNQTARDARVLMMPEMSCDRPESRMSVFLQGATVNDAITDFVKALQRDGFVAVEKVEKGTRLVLVGPGSRVASPQ